MKKTLLIIPLILFSQCENYPPTKYDVNYRNNANYNIIRYLAYGYGKDLKSYPDTTIYFDKPGGIIYSKSYVVTASSTPIEDIVKNIPSDTLSIYYFHPDTLEKYSWEEIQQSYNILRRYDLSIEDILSLRDENGVPIITYPPTREMKDMKMYPPYRIE